MQLLKKILNNTIM